MEVSEKQKAGLESVMCAVHVCEATYAAMSHACDGDDSRYRQAHDMLQGALERLLDPDLERRGEAPGRRSYDGMSSPHYYRGGRRAGDLWVK